VICCLDAKDRGSRACDCGSESIGAPPFAARASYRVEVVPDLPGKARVYPGTYHIQVDTGFWGALSAIERAAVLAHEIAHDEAPHRCERCTDARAGARMRHEGYSRAAVAEAFAVVVKHRRAFENAVLGWTMADAQIRGRASWTSGLQGRVEVVRPTYAEPVRASRGVEVFSAHQAGPRYVDEPEWIPGPDVVDLGEFVIVGHPPKPKSSAPLVLGGVALAAYFLLR